MFFVFPIFCIVLLINTETKGNRDEIFFTKQPAGRIFYWLFSTSRIPLNLFQKSDTLLNQRFDSRLASFSNTSGKIPEVRRQCHSEILTILIPRWPYFRKSSQHLLNSWITFNDLEDIRKTKKGALLNVRLLVVSRQPCWIPHAWLYRSRATTPRDGAGQG